MGILSTLNLEFGRIWLSALDIVVITSFCVLYFLEHYTFQILCIIVCQSIFLSAFFVSGIYIHIIIFLMNHLLVELMMWNQRILSTFPYLYGSKIHQR